MPHPTSETAQDAIGGVLIAGPIPSVSLASEASAVERGEARRPFLSRPATTPARIPVWHPVTGRHWLASRPPDRCSPEPRSAAMADILTRLGAS